MEYKPSGTREKKAFSVYLNPELHARLEQLLPWGVKGRFIEAVLERVIDKVEKGGPAVIGAIVTGDYDPLFEGRKGDSDG